MIDAIRVRDPTITASVTVYVAVRRNPSTPTFQHGELVFNITEDITLQEVFGDVNATDPDVVSLMIIYSTTYSSRFMVQ